MTDPVDLFIACRCDACERLDNTTSATFPNSDSPEMRACWEDVEKSCPRYAAAFGTVCAAVDDRQQELFQ
jgi:hypothetical protein